MATIRDVARRADVSIATVSATLSRSAFVSEALRARVLAAVDELGYAPHGIARSLKTGSTRLLGLVIPDITNPFFTSLVHVVEGAAHAAGYTVLLCDSDQNMEKERVHLRVMRTHRVDGLIFCPSGGADAYAASDNLGGLPLVLIDRDAPALGADTVLLDNHAGAFEATDFLLRLGHRHLATIAGPPELTPAAERLNGFHAALAGHGIASSSAWVRHGNFVEADAYTACCELFAQGDRPTALFVANNHMLIGVMRALADLGLDCPGDVSVAAIDDFPWANAFRPRLTTVRQPLRRMGEAALSFLLERIAGSTVPPRRVLLPAELIVRDSCAPVLQDTLVR